MLHNGYRPGIDIWQKKKALSKKDIALLVGFALSSICFCVCAVPGAILSFPDLPSMEYHFADEIYRAEKLFKAIS